MIRSKIFKTNNEITTSAVLEGNLLSKVTIGDAKTIIPLLRRRSRISSPIFFGHCLPITWYLNKKCAESSKILVFPNLSVHRSTKNSANSMDVGIIMVITRSRRLAPHDNYYETTPSYWIMVNPQLSGTTTKDRKPPNTRCMPRALFQKL